MSERVGFDAGKTLFRQGDRADAAYLIIEGEAEILVDTPTGPVMIATLGAQRNCRRDGDPVRCAAHRDGARQKAAGRAAHRQGAVHAHGARISQHGDQIMRELAHRLELTNNQLLTALSEVAPPAATSSVRTHEHVPAE